MNRLRCGELTQKNDKDQPCCPRKKENRACCKTTGTKFRENSPSAPWDQRDSPQLVGPRPEPGMGSPRRRPESRLSAAFAASAAEKREDEKPAFDRNMHMCANIPVYIYIYYEYVCIVICIDIGMYVYMYIYMCMYTYSYVHMFM